MKTYKEIKIDPRKYSVYLVYNGGSVVGIYATREKAQMHIDFWGRLFDKYGKAHNFSIVEE